MMNMVSTQAHVAAEQQQQQQQQASANALRLRVVSERMSNLLRTGIRCEVRDFYSACVSLARAIDYAVTSNEVPPTVHDLPSLIKQVYERKIEPFLQPAIMVLMISIKNACRSGWFRVTDTDELLTLANEISSFFCSSGNITSESSNALQIITKIMPRFYPQMRIGHILVSLEAKPGYEVLVTDFSIPKHMAPAPPERIRLFVAQSDNIETSSCIISPPQVNFLLNGKGVERRCNASMDIGPQLPTDVTGFLKLGTNLLQVIGHFNGNYIITVAFMTIISSRGTPQLLDYVQPVVTASASDGEVIEGSSRISLNCPISYKRIKTPVKGHLCRHHQCFDYDNFIEINSRKPSWRCPHCNRPVCYTDLRIDQKMVQVLREVGEDVVHVLITADGSWKVISGSGHVEYKRDDIVDLTEEENDDRKENGSTGNKNKALDSGANRNAGISTGETEDRKPSHTILRGFSGTGNLSEALMVTGTSSAGTDLGADHQLLEDIWSRIFEPPSAANGATNPIVRPDMHRFCISESFPGGNNMHAPVLTDAVSPAPNRETADARGSVQPTPSFQNAPHVRQSVASEDIQLQHSRFGTSIISGETERSPVPRHVSYSPIAIQALPAQIPSSFQRPRTSMLDPNPTMPNGGPSSFDAANGNVERLQLSSRQQTDSHLVPDLSSSPPMQHHSIAQNQQLQQGVEHHQNQSFQQVVGLPAMSQVGARRVPEQQRMGALYNRGPSGLSQDLQRHPHPLRVLQSTNQHTIAQMASQRAAQNARPVQLQPARSGPSYPMNGDALRMSMSVDQRWNPGSTPPPALSRTDSALMEMAPTEQNWRPTGLMRGSLARHPNNPAYTQFLAQQAQPQPQTQTQTQTQTHTQVRLSTALPALGINALGPPQIYSRSGDVSRHGSSSVPHQHFEDMF